DVYGIPARVLARRDAVAIPGTPVTLKVHRFYPNSDLLRREASHPPPPVPVQGVGAGVTAIPRAPESRDDRVNHAVAYVEPVVGGASKGTFLVSNGLGQVQQFEHDGRTYLLAMRARRYHLPYSLTLKDFRHDVYPGTDIPKNFSSLVRLENPGRSESRDVLIYMNQPLRYDGKAFYQASFGEGDTLSILQVVDNPGWLLPYVSCVLVMLGLVIHFGISLRRGVRRSRQVAAQPGVAQEAA
ncbi:MAG TPA: cytochrome c biogenesis protein ResB, partial [Anaeromyxobacteraceae bacterium]|nr:cytochrome c biogenesis protein ResB [Anaeromyxobacteraceae bacterium]